MRPSRRFNPGVTLPSYWVAPRGDHREKNPPMPLPAVLFEDDVLIAFDKPSGLLVAPDRRDPRGETLLALVRAQLGPDLANVHRLEPVDIGKVGAELGAHQGKQRLTPRVPPVRGDQQPAGLVERDQDVVLK